MKLSATALGLFLSFSLTTACIAAEAEEKEVEIGKRVIRISAGNDFLEEFDADGDGLVSKDEFEAEWDGAMEADFEDFDADEDGFISEDEFEDEIEIRVEKVLDRVSVKVGRVLGRLENSFDFDFDFDFDGAEFEIEIEEHIERAMRHAEHGMRRFERRMRGLESNPERMLEKYDENDNGELDPEELEKIRQAHKAAKERHEAMKKEHAAKMEEHRAEMKERHKAMTEKMKARRAEALAKLDTDGNGTVSRDEFNQRLDQHFEKLDTNGDGELSEEELEEAHWAFQGSLHPHVRVRTKKEVR